jgi:hypothetical protein
MRQYCFRYLIAFSTVLIAASSDRLSADELIPVGTIEAEAIAEPDSLQQLEQFVTSIAHSHIPHTYEDLDDWGKQSERWDGLKVHLDGLRVKTKRRKKLVNHGTWKQYRVEMSGPKKDFQINLNNLHKSERGRTAFDIQITAPLRVHGRIAKWVKGVQLFSVSADGIAKVQLNARIEVGLSVVVTEFPPTVEILPKVLSADVVLIDFQLYRISDVGGEIAQQIGRGAESIIEKRLAKERPKLATKLNAALKKKQDKLRISSKELLASKWGKIANEHLAEASLTTEAAED